MVSMKAMRRFDLLIERDSISLGKLRDELEKHLKELSKTVQAIKNIECQIEQLTSVMQEQASFKALIRSTSVSQTILGKYYQKRESLEKLNQSQVSILRFANETKIKIVECIEPISSEILKLEKRIELLKKKREQMVRTSVCKKNLREEIQGKEILIQQLFATGELV